MHLDCRVFDIRIGRTFLIWGIRTVHRHVFNDLVPRDIGDVHAEVLPSPHCGQFNRVEWVEGQTVRSGQGASLSQQGRLLDAKEPND